MTIERDRYVHPPNGWWIRVELDTTTGELIVRRNTGAGPDRHGASPHYHDPATGLYVFHHEDWSLRPGVIGWEGSWELTDIWLWLTVDAVAFYARRMLAALEPISGTPGWDWTPTAAAYARHIGSLVGNPAMVLKPSRARIVRELHSKQVEQVKVAVPDWASRAEPLTSSQIQEVLVREGITFDGDIRDVASRIEDVLLYERPDDAPRGVRPFQWHNLVTLEHAIRRIPELVDPAWATMSDAELDECARTMFSRWVSADEASTLREGTDWSDGGQPAFVGLYAGLRRWRAAAAEAMTGHPVVEATGWYGDDRPVPDDLTADLSDLDLAALAGRVAAEVAHEHQVTLVGLIDLFTTVRAGLRQQVRDELERVGARTKQLEDDLRDLRTTRAGLVLRVAGWADRDDRDPHTGVVNMARLAGLARMSRQAVDQMLHRAGLETGPEKLTGPVVLMLRDGQWLLRHNSETLLAWPAGNDSWSLRDYAQGKAARHIEQTYGQFVLRWNRNNDDAQHVLRGILA